jgi:hypothetical protein
MSSPEAAKNLSSAARAPQGADKIIPTIASSEDATRLAAALEHALAEGRLDALSPEALQALTAAICKTYSAQIEGGSTHPPIAHRTAISSTDVMTMASGLLRATDLAVFELGMWQSWTGR